MEEYARVWDRFTSERRLEFGGHTDPAWNNGHALSASFMVPVDAAAIRDRLEPLRDALRPFPFVSLHPDRFLHVTLLLLGFVVPEPGSEKEVSRERLRELESGAREALRGFPAFPVELANLNAFPGAVFIEAHDGGMLRRLRDATCEGCGISSSPGPPHLTIAYVQAPDGSPAPEEFVAAVERYRDWPVGEIVVEGVELTLLNLVAAEYPKPETLAKIPLEG
jgi:RNA 2',3'-cyclic 3'-phosphodiesterase